MVDAGQGFFGTGRNASFEGITQIVNIPHLRNQYAKVGMFGAPKVDFFLASDTGFLGNQVRGFGFVHDGSVDTLFRFLTAVVFRPLLTSGFPLINANGTRRDVEQFLLAFDTDLAPIVGQQVTLTNSNGSTVGPRIDLMIQRAETPFVSKALGGAVRECDLVAQGRGIFKRPDLILYFSKTIKMHIQSNGQLHIHSAAAPIMGNVVPINGQSAANLSQRSFIKSNCNNN